MKALPPLSSDLEKRIEALAPGEVLELDTYPRDALLVPVKSETAGIVTWEPGMSQEESVRRMRQAMEKIRAEREIEHPAGTSAEPFASGPLPSSSPPGTRTLLSLLQGVKRREGAPALPSEEEGGSEGGSTPRDPGFVPGRITVQQATPEELAAARRACGWKEGQE